MTDSFSPDWISCPGETIEDLLEERGWSLQELALQTGYSFGKIEDIVIGALEIDRDIAETLHQTIGGSVDFWLAREKIYRDAVAALEKAKYAAG
jgi:HTH-type transcriptional regulator/antitoxin HigA